jgi:hypothetical protein
VIVHRAAKGLSVKEERVQFRVETPYAVLRNLHQARSHGDVPDRDPAKGSLREPGNVDELLASEIRLPAGALVAVQSPS